MTDRMEIDFGNITMKRGSYYGTTAEGETVKLELGDLAIELGEGRCYRAYGYATTEFFKTTFHIEAAIEIFNEDFGLEEYDVKNIEKVRQRYYGLLKNRDVPTELIIDDPYITLEEGMDYRVKGYMKTTRFTISINVLNATPLNSTLPRLTSDSTPEYNIANVYFANGELHGVAENGSIVKLIPAEPTVQIEIGYSYRLKGQLFTQRGRHKQGVHDYTLQVEYIVQNYTRWSNNLI